MISYFPSIYPDELLYSQLARYYAKAGYLAYTFAAEDLFEDRHAKINIRFVNKYTASARAMITREIPMEAVIERHTMFPYYVRFLPRQRRERALQALVNMNENFHNILHVPQQQTKQYLRYCPVCATEDRDKYGETYWHRSHQMTGIHICAEHFCQLQNSNVMISSTCSPTFITAEEAVSETETVMQSQNPLECQLAEYVMQVFQARIDMQGDIAIGRFLHSRMEHTKYLSLRGEQRNIQLIHSDFVKYYRSLEQNPFKELWQLQKVFTSDRFNTYEVCLIAMFLNITADDLVCMKLPARSQQELFDAQVRHLRDQGLNYRQIADQMHASYNVVKPIGENRYGRKEEIK